MTRRGELTINSAEVRKAVMQMEPLELECNPCDEANKQKVHPSNKNTATVDGRHRGPVPTLKGQQTFFVRVRGA